MPSGGLFLSKGPQRSVEIERYPSLTKGTFPLSVMGENGNSLSVNGIDFLYFCFSFMFFLQSGGLWVDVKYALYASYCHGSPLVLMTRRRLFAPYGFR